MVIYPRSEMMDTDTMIIMVRLYRAYPSLRIRNYDLSPHAAEPKPGAGTAGDGHHSNSTAYGQCFYKDGMQQTYRYG